MIAVAALLRVVDSYYYRDSQRVLRHLGLAPRIKHRESYYRSLDPIFAPLPFLWNWCEIIGTTLLAVATDQFLGYFALVLFVGARFRALQETAHTAVHFGLCRRRRWQWGLSDLLFQYPCFKPDMRHRCTAHVQEHHRHANEREDPNVARFVSIGFVPGISRTRFHFMLLHPLLPSGLAETLRMAAHGASRNRSTSGALARVVVVSALALTLFSMGGWKSLAFGYLIPLLTIYPWFSWISLLVEHRWFADCRESDRIARECINGRPTDYYGLSGLLIKHFILPATDHYHLAHSLYPYVRWNYVAAIDEALKQRDDRYGRFRSEGFLWPQSALPSALSELRERMTSAGSSDLASWVSPIERTRA